MIHSMIQFVSWIIVWFFVRSPVLRRRFPGGVALSFRLPLIAPFGWRPVPLCCRSAGSGP